MEDLKIGNLFGAWKIRNDTEWMGRKEQEDRKRERKIFRIVNLTERKSREKPVSSIQEEYFSESTVGQKIKYSSNSGASSDAPLTFLETSFSAKRPP